VKIVYLDQLGCFASVVMAACSMGRLPTEANYRDILNLPYFADEQNCQPGKLYYLGKDQAGTDFYTLGVGSFGNFIKAIVWPELLKLTKFKEEIIIFDVSDLNLFILNYLEILSRGKLRRASKYFWAYWLAKKMRSC